MIVAVDWVRLGLVAFGVYLVFAALVGWLKYERWLRARRRGDVQIGPSGSRGRRVR